MNVLDIRGRILVAMGLSAASVVACSKERERPEPRPVSSTAGETPNATPSVSASAMPNAVASASASASANLPAFPPVTGMSGGPCGFVVVCQDQAKAAPAQHAPAPFERCADAIGEHDTGSEPHGEGPFDEDITKTRRATTPNVCCYKGRRLRCGGGRPLRGPSGPVVADVALRADWLDATLATTRVASVHSAALDEIAHARALFALAARRGAATHGPGPLAVDQAPLVMTFGAFVHDTFLDGCIAETSAAIEVRSRADDGDDIERTTLARIADDEERHAELSWRMLAWGLRAGGADARASLHAAVGLPLET